MGFGAVGRRLFEDLRCDPAVLLDSASLNASWDPRAVHFSIPRSASGGRKSVNREGKFTTLTEGQSVQASGRFFLLGFAKFLGEGLGGWVSMEEGLPQHAFKMC